MSLMLGSVLVLMLPLLVWLTPDLRIKKRLLAFSRRLHARIRKTRYMHNFFFSSIRRHTISLRDWSSDVCSSDLFGCAVTEHAIAVTLQESLEHAAQAR